MERERGLISAQETESYERGLNVRSTAASGGFVFDLRWAGSEIATVGNDCRLSRSQKKGAGVNGDGLDVVGFGGAWWGKFGGLLGFWAQELIEPHYGALSAL